MIPPLRSAENYFFLSICRHPIADDTPNTILLFLSLLPSPKYQIRTGQPVFLVADKMIDLLDKFGALPRKIKMAPVPFVGNIERTDLLLQTGGIPTTHFL